VVELKRNVRPSAVTCRKAHSASQDPAWIHWISRLRDISHSGNPEYTARTSLRHTSLGGLCGERAASRPTAWPHVRLPLYTSDTVISFMGVP
jgi:hypothetical protein